jgi:hypothetical protein
MVDKLKNLTAGKKATSTAVPYRSSRKISAAQVTDRYKSVASKPCSNKPSSVTHKSQVMLSGPTIRRKLFSPNSSVAPKRRKVIVQPSSRAQKLLEATKTLNNLDKAPDETKTIGRDKLIRKEQVLCFTPSHKRKPSPGKSRGGKNY